MNPMNANTALDRLCRLLGHSPFSGRIPQIVSSDTVNLICVPLNVEIQQEICRRIATSGCLFDVSSLLQGHVRFAMLFFPPQAEAQEDAAVLRLITSDKLRPDVQHDRLSPLLRQLSNMLQCPPLHASLAAVIPQMPQETYHAPLNLISLCFLIGVVELGPAFQEGWLNLAGSYLPSGTVACQSLAYHLSPESMRRVHRLLLQVDQAETDVQFQLRMNRLAALPLPTADRRIQLLSWIEEVVSGVPCSNIVVVRGFLHGDRQTSWNLSQLGITRNEIHALINDIPDFQASQTLLRVIWMNLEEVTRRVPVESLRVFYPQDVLRVLRMLDAGAREGAIEILEQIRPGETWQQDQMAIFCLESPAELGLLVVPPRDLFTMRTLHDGHTAVSWVSNIPPPPTALRLHNLIQTLYDDDDNPRLILEDRSRYFMPRLQSPAHLLPCVLDLVHIFHLRDFRSMPGLWCGEWCDQQRWLMEQISSMSGREVVFGVIRNALSLLH